MAKKILFIYPDFIDQTKHIRTFPGNYSEGLASLSASLKLSGHETDMYHMTWMPEKEDFIAQVKSRNADVIGFTIRTTIVDAVTVMLGWLDDEMPGVPVMCGGCHVTLSPESVLATRGVDMVCVGEGEIVTRDLVDSLDKNGEFDMDSPSFWFKLPDGSFKKNAIRPYLTDLDELPFPDLDIFDFANLSATRIDTAEVVVSRGCLYSCTYCSNANMRQVYDDKKNYARFRSPENAIQLLERVIARQPSIQYFAFNDAILNMYEEWFFEFIELYKARIGRKFTCNLRFDHMDEKMGDLLAEGGCYKITIGLENGNEEFRKKYLKRNMKNDHMINISKMLHSKGIIVLTYNIVGLPYETLALSLETIKLNAKLHTDSIVVAIYYPYPGTELMRITEEGGFIDPNAKLNDKVQLKMPDYTKNEILFMRYSFLKLIKRYRKIFKMADTAAAQKKEAALDKRLLSGLYPHTLMYWKNYAGRQWGVKIRELAKRFMPRRYNKMREKKYSLGK